MPLKAKIWYRNKEWWYVPFQESTWALTGKTFDELIRRIEASRKFYKDPDVIKNNS